MKFKYISALLIFNMPAIAQKSKVGKTDATIKPNIILIQMDDLGWDDLSCHQNKFVETKNIDKLASQSMVFERFYVNPVSSASRASLLTGRFFLRTGVSHVHGGKDFINAGEQLLPQILKKAGYTTAMFGKWHSGNTFGYLPWQRGFDVAFMSDLYKHENASGLFNNEKIVTDKWSDELITNYGIGFIEKTINPFFLYLSYLTPHVPLNAPQNLIAKYQNKGLSEKLATLYAMIEMADIEIGKLMQMLSQSGLEENTIVMFMSDNGPARNNAEFTDQDRFLRYTSNMRGHKGDILENGVKSPLFIKWKGKFENRINDQLCDVTDILPTICEIAGGNKFILNKIDGVSLYKNMLTGRKIDKTVYNYANIAWSNSQLPYTPEGIFNEYAPLSKQDKKALIPSNQQLSIIRNNDKLLLNPILSTLSPEKPEVFMYNIVNDKQERFNAAEQNIDTKIKLEQELLHWFESIKKEPHAFENPVFYLIGDTIKIPAYGANYISENLHKNYNSITSWGINNTFSFKIKVNKTACYTIELDFDKAPYETIEVKIDQNKLQLKRVSKTTLMTNNTVKLSRKNTVITFNTYSNIIDNGNNYNLLNVRLIKQLAKDL